MTGEVLLQARVSGHDRLTTFGRRAARLSITAADRGCTWSDGRGAQSWGLPDSPVEGRPTLAAVVYAATFLRTSGYVRFPETYVLLVAADGSSLATLAHVTSGMEGMQDSELERIWPGAGFAALEARGVGVVVEETHDIDELERRYPGTVPRLDRMTVSSRTWLVLYVLMGLMAALAFLVSWRRLG